MPLADEIRAWLADAYRAKHGDKTLNISRLCKDAKISRPTFYRLEKGNPEPATLQKLARALGVPVPQLRLDAAPILLPPATPLSRLHEARAALDRAEELLLEGQGAAIRSLEAARKEESQRVGNPDK